jgi:hypothetical protein
MKTDSSTRTLSSTSLFRLGQIVATPDALALLDRSGTDTLDLLRRHQHSDCGDLCATDARSNECAVSDGTCILSAYTLGDQNERLWILTEANRRVSTLLRPSEY